MSETVSTQLEKPFHREKLEKIRDTEKLTKAEMNPWCFNADFRLIHKRRILMKKINLLLQSFSAFLIVVKDLCLQNTSFLQSRFPCLLILRSCYNLTKRI